MAERPANGGGKAEMDQPGAMRTRRQPYPPESSSLHALGRQLALAVVSGENSAAPADDETFKQAAQTTLATVERAVGVFRANEARAETLAHRAIEQLAVANDRIRELEARALKAEVRAKEAERWLLRLQKSVEETLADWQDDGLHHERIGSAA
jgi:hypothetical protein